MADSTAVSVCGDEAGDDQWDGRPPGHELHRTARCCAGAGSFQPRRALEPIAQLLTALDLTLGRVGDPALAVSA